jgi:hypothetical protein
MQNPISPPAPARFPTFTRLRRWLFNWRMLRRLLVAAAALVTLMGLFYAVEDWRGKRAWENYQRQAEARGVEMDWHKFVPPPVPDAQNFAMTPFLAPVLDFNPKPLQPGQSAWRDTNGQARAMNFARDVKAEIRDLKGNITDLSAVLNALHEGSNAPALTVPISTRAEAAAELLREFEQFEPVLDEIRLASQRSYSRFNISYGDEDPWSIWLPHLAVVKHLGQVLFFRASAELELGKTDAALTDARLMVYLAQSVRDEPIVISHLVRAAILKYAEQIIWEGLAEHRWSEPQLLDLQLRLEGTTIFKDFERPLAAERAADNTLFDLVRKNPRLFASVVGDASTPELVFRLMPGGWIYREQTTLHQFYDEKILPGMEFAAARVHPRTIDDNANSLEKVMGPGLSMVWHHRLFSALLLPALSAIAQKSAFAQTCADEATLACALERYRLAKGEFPETLGALAPRFIQTMPHDVITGQPLIYRRTENGQFILYSVGWNESDDAGKVVMNDKGKAIDITQGDWVWPEYPGK